MQTKKRSRLKYILAFGIPFVICFILSFLFYVFNNEDFKKGLDKGFAEGFEREFIAGCTSGGAPEENCQCVFNELQKKHSFTELTLWGAEVEQTADKAADACGFEPKEAP